MVQDKNHENKIVEFDELVREIMEECDVFAITVYKEGVETGGIAMVKVCTRDSLDEIRSKYSKVNLYGDVCSLYLDVSSNVDPLGEIPVYIEDTNPHILVEDGRELNKSSVEVEEGLKRVCEVAESSQDSQEGDSDE